jgi:enediyne biosynthesis protein E4
MNARVPLTLGVTSAVLASALALARAQPAGVLFRDITEEAGITFRHHSDPEKRYIVESISGGVALVDVDNDGLLDIYFVNSLTVATMKTPGVARSALYRNLGGGKFQDVTDKAGVGSTGWGMGVCTADIDGDGWEDLYVTAIGGNRLYRNNGNGTFSDITKQAGAAVGGWSTGCAFADYDRDGHLDLFVSRYVEVDFGKLPPFGGGPLCQYRGVPVQCGPRGLRGQSDVLLRNDGKGRFVDVTAKAGLSDRAYYGLGVAWFDADGDGWPDVYVANDTNPNFLYLNQRNGTFREAAVPMGVAVSEDGAEQGGMGVAVGDYDQSGRFSIWVTNYAEEYNALYQNAGGHFADVSFRSKSAASSVPYVGWGNAFLDYDNDGLLDKIAVNGHVFPQADQAKAPTAAGYRQRALLYRNVGKGLFEEVAGRYGRVLTVERASRGLAIGDLDNDGRLDVVINDIDGSPQVLRNELAGAGNWLLVRLKGRAPNTSAVGAVVTARTGGMTERRLVQAGSGYLSQDDKRAHFGLGKAAQVDVLEVTWPDGKTTTLKNVKANQIVEVEQPR